MSKIFECSTCGIVTEEKGHLCRPVELEGQGDYCGQPAEDTAKMCNEETARFAFECGNCGRPAEKADLICNPSEVRK